MAPLDSVIRPLIAASRKSLAFALAAALGCAIGALLGEPFLALTRSGGGGTATCLLIDTSGSMDGASIEEVRQAAIAYAQRQRFASTQLTLVLFDSTADLTCPPLNEATPGARILGGDAAPNLDASRAVSCAGP